MLRLLQQQLYVSARQWHEIFTCNSLAVIYLMVPYKCKMLRSGSSQCLPKNESQILVITKKSTQIFSLSDEFIVFKCLDYYWGPHIEFNVDL